MPPNERGACSVCLTLDWECVCEDRAKAKRGRFVEPESDSELSYEDVVEEAKRKDEEYGVDWRLFGSRSVAVAQAILMVTKASCQVVLRGRL